MSRTLKLIIIEDSPDDAELMAYRLRREGFDVHWSRVETEPAFLSQLEQGPPDLIISDHSMPAFSGLRALDLVQARRLDIPFILVSGSIGEEAAVEAIRRGATDYLLKDRIARLGSAVERALEERAAREARQQAESALRQSEEHLRQAQKLELIGQLAGGVAHDFNNVLAVIQGLASLMRATPDLPLELQEAAEQMIHASERGAGLTRELLAFSRKQIVQPRNLDLNEVITHLSRMLTRMLGTAATLELRCAPGLPLVHADEVMMQQVLMNLAVNARDAFAGNGCLRIETSLVTPQVGQPARTPGPHVCITVSDNGRGIPEAVLPKIFEPFFTTKSAGRGTGLGLATVQVIVRQHRGWIEVQSKVGRGTTFRIFLPTASGSVGAVGDGQKPQAPTGTETILVVEDEDALRRLVSGMLQRRGYRVLEAEDGPAALRTWQVQAGKIDLLFTDMMMPGGLSGLELARRLRAESPRLHVIYTSAYNPESFEEGLILQPGLNFLQKPYSLTILVQTVRAAFDRKA